MQWAFDSIGDCSDWNQIVEHKSEHCVEWNTIGQRLPCIKVTTHHCVEEEGGCVGGNRCSRVAI